MSTFSHEPAAVGKLRADFFGFQCFYAFQKKSQTRRVIVAPLCSSSAAVASHRLALCHKLKQAQWTCCLHPTALLSRCGGPVMGHICPRTDPLVSRFQKLTVTLKLNWCWDLNPSDVSTYSLLSHNATDCSTFQWNKVQKALYISKNDPNARFSVCNISSEWSKCRCFLK